MDNILSHNKRIDYGQSLMPDDGWSTSWAIGTTYSLDLEVLMSIPLALFHGKYLSETTDLQNLRTDMLDALNKVRERMFVFVHENNIRSQAGYSMLMGFLDQNIWNVPVDDVNQNFHPKVWLIRYEKESNDKKGHCQYKYRLVVMSRNITGATDFDIAVSMDSIYCETEVNDNRSVIAMMATLMQRTGRKDIVKQLQKELKTIRFIPPCPFDQKPSIFWPHTFQGLKSPLLEDTEYEDLLVVSPFVDDKTLDRLSARVKSKKPILVSREYEMDKCSPSVLDKWECYQWNSMLEEAEDYEEAETEDKSIVSRSISLHAKIFIVRAALGRDWNIWNNWFIGSTNCTNAGLTKNFEAQLQIKSNDEGASPRSVIDVLASPDAPLVTTYHPKSQSSNKEELFAEEQDKRQILFELSKLPLKAEVQEIHDGRYNTCVSFSHDEWCVFWEKHPNVKVSLNLFCDKTDKWDLSKDCNHIFKSVQCQLLSAFLQVKVIFNKESEKVFLLRLPEIEMPVERHGKIMSEILDSEDKLMRYLMFCLDAQMDNEQQKIGKEYRASHHSVKDNSVWPRYSLPIYEKLLLAASRDKEALNNVKRNVDKLKGTKGKDGKPLLSKEFMNMWNLFSSYANDVR